jgi:hypothetical protein
MLRPANTYPAPDRETCRGFDVRFFCPTRRVRSLQFTQKVCRPGHCQDWRLKRCTSGRHRVFPICDTIGEMGLSENRAVVGHDQHAKLQRARTCISGVCTIFQLTHWDPQPNASFGLRGMTHDQCCFCGHNRPCQLM